MKKKVIGHYLLGKQIGSGIYWKVKSGIHMLTGEKICIKVVSKEKIKKLGLSDKIS